jgi:hypothetical protein
MNSFTGRATRRHVGGVEGDWQLFAVHRPGNPSNR